MGFNSPNKIHSLVGSVSFLGTSGLKLVGGQNNIWSSDGDGGNALRGEEKVAKHRHIGLK